MNHDKKFSIIIISIFFCYGMFLFFVPISRSDKAVRQYLLRKIPLGTSWNETIQIIEKNEKWELEYKSQTYGVVKYKSFDHFLIGNTQDENKVQIGEQSMVVYLGEYYFPNSHVVKAYLAFDKDGNLIEIGINKDIDCV
ncbi:MAG: hypothetical protein K2H93_04660 [Oscillospiraceae bacterium]|nr:hypothetical protein [Oscillospiraceae bacterium]